MSSSAPPGVLNQGMIYLGPVRGSGGSWTSIDVPAGAPIRSAPAACPRARARCFVIDTIAKHHGQSGGGQPDLNPSVPGGVISANAFIYNMSRHQWTLLDLGRSLSSQTTLYGIWQDGGKSSPDYTLAGGSAASGHKRAFVMNYNERTGTFGTPKYFRYGNGPALVTHFEGITGVPGGFNLVAMSCCSGCVDGLHSGQCPQGILRHCNVVSSQCHGKPVVFRWLQSCDREYRA